MRIAVITSSFLPRIGGAEFAVHHLARHWSLQDHQVCVFHSVPGQAATLGINYEVRRYREPCGGFRFGQHRFPFRAYGTRQMARLLKEFRPHFVSAHFAYPVALWLSRVSPPPPYLITVHGPGLNESPTGPRRKFGIDTTIAEALNTALGVVALSTHAHRGLEMLGVEPKRIVDIPNGVDVDRFRRIVKFDVRGKFGIPPDALVVLSVGRESWAKDYRTGIGAFVEASKPVSSVYYLILGRGVKKWQGLLSESAASANVILCEGLYEDELVAAYQQADIFFLPSVKEMFPLVVLEAMAAGLPCVVTDVSGSQDAIISGENGIVVSPGNRDAMVGALRDLIGDSALRRRLGEANSKRVDRYRWDRISRMYLEAFGRLAGPV